MSKKDDSIPFDAKRVKRHQGATKKRRRKKATRTLPMEPLEDGLRKILVRVHLSREAFDQLDELCKLRGLSTGQFIAETMKSFPRWDQFIGSRSPFANVAGCG